MTWSAPRDKERARAYCSVLNRTFDEVSGRRVCSYLAGTKDKITDKDALGKEGWWARGSIGSDCDRC